MNASFPPKRDGGTKERESRKKSSLNVLDNLRSLYLDYITRGLFGECTVGFNGLVQPKLAANC